MLLSKYSGEKPVRIPLLLVTAFVCYVTLIPVAVLPDSRGWEIAAAVIFILLTVWIFLEFLAWTRARFHTLESTNVLLWGVADVVLSVYHALAALGMAIWLLDSATEKDGVFVLIDKGTSRYGVFVGDFLYMTVLSFNSMGLHIAGPRPSRVIGQLWIMTTSVWGTVVIALLMGIVVQQVRLAEQCARQQQSSSFQTAKSRLWSK